MSWRPSQGPRYTSGRTARDTSSTLDPTTRILIGVAIIVGLLSVGILAALGVARSQGGATAAATAAPAALPPTVAPTAPAAATSAPAIVSSRATPTPAPTISPAEAGPVESSGNAEAGRALFTGMPTEALLAGAVMCSTCHNVDPGSATLIGPSLDGVATRAATRVADLSTAQYLRASIIAPNSYVVEGFAPGIMTPTFGKALTPAQIEDLVAYLLTLK